MPALNGKHPVAGYRPSAEETKTIRALHAGDLYVRASEFGLIY